MIKKTQDQIMKDWPSYSIPTVSICCISFNHQEFISEALDSFLVQETSFPFEIIVRDDASQDNSQKILSAYEKKYPKIIKLILEKENQYSKGVRPLPVTFKEAKGKYLAVCEGDDYWIDNSKLQKQFDYMKVHENVSMCFHDAKIVGLNQKSEPELFCRFKAPLYTTKDIIINEWFIPSQSMFLRRECVENVPNSFDRVFNGDMAIQLISSTYGPIGYLDSVMSAYRKHSNSASMTFAKDGEFVCRKIISLLEIFDEFSDEKFHSEINERKGLLQKQLNMVNLRKKNIALFCLQHPKKSFGSLLKWIKRVSR